MQNQDNINSVNGGFFVRLAAYLIDTLIVAVALMFLRFPMWIVSIFNTNNPLTNPILFQFSVWDIFLYLLSVTYFVVTTYFSGRTIGKRLMNLKVVTTTGEKLTLINTLYRETIGRYLSSLMCLGYILIAVDNGKRGLHDILCNTKVVYSNVVLLVDNETNNQRNDTISNNKIEEVKVEEIKTEEIKTEEIKAEEIKAEETE